MLPYQLQHLLKLAAETKDPERIDNTIQMVKLMSPKHFFRVDKDGKDIDPMMRNRMFFNMPMSSHWSGDFVTPRDEYRHQEGKKYR